jgi:hypothetical protein
MAAAAGLSILLTGFRMLHLLTALAQGIRRTRVPARLLQPLLLLRSQAGAATLTRCLPAQADMYRPRLPLSLARCTHQCTHGCQVATQLCLVVVHQQGIGHHYQGLPGCQRFKDTARA